MFCSKNDIPATWGRAIRTATQILNSPWAWFMAFVLLCPVGCERTVECLSDSDCSDEAYCVATRCQEPTPLEGRREAYVQQVAPLIEVNCGCHGEKLGRPWSFDHASFEPEKVDQNLKSIGQWAYDGYPDPMVDDPVGFSFMGFALARCGFAHPGIFANATQPQYLMLERFLSTFLAEFPESPRDDEAEFPDPLDDGPETSSLDDEIERILAKPYDEALREDIIPRVVGQCGCCHQQGGERGFQLALGSLDDEMIFAFNAEAMEFDVFDRGAPDFSAVIEFGLGFGGRGVAHPVIYTGIDDPRLHLLRRWVEEGEGPPDED